MIELSINEMMESYFVAKLEEIREADSGQDSEIFTCKDPKLYDLFVQWLNAEDPGTFRHMTMIDSTNFRFTIDHGTYSVIFDIYLQYPNMIEAKLVDDFNVH
jgi:succinate dehydrogenase flavin-adding protein (antitoxin of CptAB toxin-antitoxin module)